MKINLYLKRIVNLNNRYAFFLLKLLRKFFLLFERFFIPHEKKQAKKVIDLFLKDNTFPAYILSVLNFYNLKEFKSLFKIHKNDIISEAEKYANCSFYLLGKKINFKDKIDWHLDFNSGFRWERGLFYRKYNQVDVSNNVDVKYPRELSRSHHILILGQAYLFTNDEKYTNAFIDQVSDWILENPYKKSINWGCSMDVAIRASNWIYALGMFVSSPRITESFLKSILNSLYLHGKYIYGNPEKNYLQNHNHFLSDLAGQILLGLLFKGNNEPDIWLEDGINSLFREIRLQILPSGPSYERSVHYHRLVTELIAYTIITLRNNQYPFLRTFCTD